MPPEPIFPGQRLEALMAAGLWGDGLIIDQIDQMARKRPDAIAVVDHNSTSGARTELSFGRLRELSLRVAAGLMARGIAPGDVVAVQLPSWWHYFVLYPACARIGAVINPLMPIFRERELKFMLGLPRTKLIVVPKSFRGFDYPAMIEGLRGELPDLAHMLVVMGDDPDTSFETNMLECAEADQAELAARRPGANDVTEVFG